nr:thrombospondin type 3 repeat-containing protein [uncultured Flavobacterium sp.]
MKKIFFLCTCLAFTYITSAVNSPRYNGDLENDFCKTDKALYGSGDLNDSLSEIKDSDNDGVADKKDKCPDTLAGVQVDKTGCPLDKDLDGTADYLDECADTAGPLELKGCPDVDKDGVADAKDRCPDFAGSVELKGCPDVDKDGVPDIDDKCENTTPGYKVDASGCPIDNDNDGVPNEVDLCPDTAGPLALKGCPDTDGDGVTDNIDRCPTEKGNIIDNGCPKIIKVIKRK